MHDVGKVSVPRWLLEKGEELDETELTREARVIVLSGEGYSLMWPESEEPRRFDWQVGTLIVPPERNYLPETGGENG